MKQKIEKFDGMINIQNRFLAEKFECVKTNLSWVMVCVLPFFFLNQSYTAVSTMTIISVFIPSTEQLWDLIRSLAMVFIAFAFLHILNNLVNIFSYTSSILKMGFFDNIINLEDEELNINILIASRNFPRCRTYNKAKEACKLLGEDWRLPTEQELKIMNKNSDVIGGFLKGPYWSSTINNGIRISIEFNSLLEDSFKRKGNECYVRPVRTLNIMK